MTHAVRRETVTPGGAKVGGFAPSASVPVSPGGVTAGGIAPVAHIVSVVYVIGTHDGYHIAADHDDLIAYGTELALVIALVFVGAKLVVARLLR
jgi:hypothetical protein